MTKGQYKGRYQAFKRKLIRSVTSMPDSDLWNLYQSIHNLIQKDQTNNKPMRIHTFVNVELRQFAFYSNLVFKWDTAVNNFILISE